MTVTYPSSNSFDMATAVLAGLSGATISIRNTVGGSVTTTSAPMPTLSSSPGFVLPDGTIVVIGSTIGYYYDSNTGIVDGGSVILGDVMNIPVVSGPVAIVAVNSTGKYVYLVGAVLRPPVSGSGIMGY